MRKEKSISVPASNLPKAALEDDVRAEIVASIDEILADIDSGRMANGESRWIESAAARWHRAFLQELANITEKPEFSRVARCSQVAGPAWSRVDAALALEDKKTPQIYQRFFESFGQLLETWKEIEAEKQATAKG